MATKRQQIMSRRGYARARSEGLSRKRPGIDDKSRFYRIEVRPKSEFVAFRTQDIGKKNGLERITGKRSSSSWDTDTWLVEKNRAHVDKSGKLIIDDPQDKTALKQIRGPIMHKKGDVFTAKPRKNIKEDAKPTTIQRRTQAYNIQKTQRARRIFRK